MAIAMRCSPNLVRFLCKFNLLQVLLVSFENPDKGGLQELLLHSIFLRGYVTQGAMWPELTIFLPPIGNQYLSLGQCGEDFTIEQFIPQFTVE